MLTLEEAASLLRIDPWDLEDLAWLGRVPGYRTGAKWRFDKAGLLAWRNGRGETASPPRDSGPTSVAATRTISRQETAQEISTNTGSARPAGVPLAVDALSNVQGRGGNTEQTNHGPVAREGEPEAIGEDPDLATAEEVFLRERSILLASGEVTLELGLFYSEQSDQELVLLQNGAALTPALGVQREETYSTVYTARYGLFNGTEVFGGIPLQYRRSELSVGGVELSDSRTEFGDVTAGARHTIVGERGGWPEVLVTMEGRVPTGASSYAVGGGLAVVKSMDPAALYASANCLHRFSREFSDVTRLQAEDTVDATLGYALALNDRLTVSTAFSGVFMGNTEFTIAEIPQQERFSLQLGLTSFLAQGLFIEPTVSFSLNDTGNDVVFGVSLPYTFEP